MNHSFARFSILFAVLLFAMSEVSAQPTSAMPEKDTRSIIPIDGISASSKKVAKFLEAQILNHTDEATIVDNLKRFIQQESESQLVDRKVALTDLGLKCNEVSCVYIGVYINENSDANVLASTAVEIQIKVNYTYSSEVHALLQSITKDSSLMKGTMVGEFLHRTAPFESARGFTRDARAFIKGAPADLRTAGFICADLCRYEGEQSRTIYFDGNKVTERYRYTIHVVDPKRPESILTKQEKIN